MEGHMATNRHMKTILAIIVGALVILTAQGPATSVYAQDASKDGIYDAQVTTDSGTYSVPVEVQDGAVAHVLWPNGGAMNVYDGDLEGGSASGTNSRGEAIHIEIDDPSYNPQPDDK
jgi:hypothetical protein